MVDLTLIKHASAGMDAGCMLEDHVLAVSMQCNDRSEKTPWFPTISITSISFPVHEKLHSTEVLPISTVG